MYHYHCTPFFTSNTLSHQVIRFIFRVPIRTCWSLNIFKILGLVQYFLSSTISWVLSYQPKCMTSAKFVKWQDFSKVQWKCYAKNTHLFCLERYKLNAEVSQWEKAQLPSSHYFCHIQFPKDLTSKLFSMASLRHENQRANNWAQGHLGLKMQKNINM